MSPEFSALIDTKIVTESLVLDLFIKHFDGETELCDCRENRENRLSSLIIAYNRLSCFK